MKIICVSLTPNFSCRLFDKSYLFKHDSDNGRYSLEDRKAKQN
jgi:hypothetical protein